MGVEWAWRWAGRGEGAAATHGPRRTRRLRAAARPRPHPMSHAACALFHVHHSLFDPSSCPALGQLLKTRANRRHGRAATLVGLGPARCSALPYAGRPPITLPAALLPARLCRQNRFAPRQSPGPPQRVSQQELHLSVERAHLVIGPSLQLRVQGRVEAEKKGFTLGHENHGQSVIGILKPPVQRPGGNAFAAS